MEKQKKLINKEEVDNLELELKVKIGPEEKVKQEKIIPFLREVLGYKIMDFEVPIRFGRMTKFADIVISIVEKNRKYPHIVVECKAPNKIGSQDWLQAESYAQRLGAEYFVVTDGTNNGWNWYKTGKRQGESKLIESKQIPHETIKKEGEVLIKFEDLNTLSRVMQQCHDIIRNEEGKDPAQSFDEMAKILFAKMKDERNQKEKKKVEREFLIKIDDKGNIKDTKSSVADRIKVLFNNAKKDFPDIYTEVIESENIKKIVSINLRDNTIYQLVGILEPYTFIETQNDEHGIDIKGSMFEIFLKGTFRGPLGQFFTPRQVIDFMVNVVDPKDNETVLDPACGSGGFLIGVMKKMWYELNEKYIAGRIDDLEEEKRDYTKNNLFGMEINDRLAWVAKMNMVFHGDGHGGIKHCNALLKTTRNKEIFDKKFDIILTNPPFGSKINDVKILSDERYLELSKYKLTEILFLGLCLDLLAPNGRLGIVLPDGILSNASLKYVRDWLKKNSVIKAVISLPEETFRPYGAGIKASLLFLEKKDLKNPYHKQGPVFMGMVKNIGYDSTGRKIEGNELEGVLNEYRKFEEKYYKS